MLKKHPQNTWVSSSFSMVLALFGENMDIKYRKARENDLPLLVKLLAEDNLGAERENASEPLNQKYVDAFTGIEADSNNELVVIESNGELVGMLQLTFIPYLTYMGSWRCLIEGVRIEKNSRGKGLGNQLLIWAVERARERKCSIVQLTSDKKRQEAIRFYESLGFEATHEGFKLKL